MATLREEITAACLHLWQEHRGAAVGLLLGSLVGICILLFGFWHIIFIALCGAVGVYIGRRKQSSESLLPQAWDRFVRRHDHDLDQYTERFR